MSREVSKTATQLTHFNSRFFYLALFAIIILSLAYFLGVFDQRKNKKNSRKEKIDEPSQDDDNLPSRARHLEEFQYKPNSGIQRNISPSVPIHHIKPSIIPRIIQSKKLYDPSKIDERMSIYVGKFLASNNDDIDIRNASIPGIGPSAIELLEREKIFLVCQLIGKFLSFKRAGITTQEHCDFFWKFLRDIGIEHNRSLIVQAIAEKTNSKLPGIYDPRELIQE
jgi:hypothetical protein